MADTGTSLNMIPDADFNRIFQTFFAESYNCRVLPNTLTSCDCTVSQHDSIPDINFDIGSETYVIPRDQWFERSGYQCVIKFMHGPSKDYWILGLNFFTNYYTVFDYESLSIGFAPSVNFLKPSEKSFVKWATGEDTEVIAPTLMNLNIVNRK